MHKFMDLTGQQFGKLIVEELVGKDKYYDKLWKCRRANLKQIESQLSDFLLNC